MPVERKKTTSGGEIIIYSGNGPNQIDVRLDGETVWLNQSQIADLFGKDVRTVNEHLGNIYKEQEVTKKATIRKFRIVQKEGDRKVQRNVQHFNLDVIISVGYRVKSKQGTKFRIWANKVLKEYLVKGYAINEQRLKSKIEKLTELQKTVDLLTSLIERRELKDGEATGLLKVIRDYTYALDLLDQYDHQEIEITDTNKKEAFKLTYEEALAAIEGLKRQLSDESRKETLFGKEKDESFKGSLYNIYQSFEGKALYPSIEEKAAHLLYFVIKNHSFIDGNKRIAAFVFIWFLEKNFYLYRLNGAKRIEDNALVAICLMIAESRPQEKEIIIKLVVNLINRRN